MKIDYKVDLSPQGDVIKKLILIAENEAEKYQLQAMSIVKGCAPLFAAFLSFELK